MVLAIDCVWFEFDMQTSFLVRSASAIDCRPCPMWTDFLTATSVALTRMNGRRVSGRRLTFVDALGPTGGTFQGPQQKGRKLRLYDFQTRFPKWVCIRYIYVYGVTGWLVRTSRMFGKPKISQSPSPTLTLTVFRRPSRVWAHPHLKKREKTI